MGPMDLITVLCCLTCVTHGQVPCRYGCALANTSISVSPEATEDDPSGKYSVGGEMQPGQVCRFVLVLPRVYLDNPHASIPVVNTGTRRQFVVSANKLSFEAEAASREAFWFREELLKRVLGGWKEPATGREGSIDLRNLRLNNRMVEAMRLEDIEMTFSLISPSSSETTPGVEQTGRSASA